LLRALLSKFLWLAIDNIDLDSQISVNHTLNKSIKLLPVYYLVHFYTAQQEEVKAVHWTRYKVLGRVEAPLI